MLDATVCIKWMVFLKTLLNINISSASLQPENKQMIEI